MMDQADDLFGCSDEVEPCQKMYCLSSLITISNQCGPRVFRNSKLSWVLPLTLKAGACRKNSPAKCQGTTPMLSTVRRGSHRAARSGKLFVHQVVKNTPDVGIEQGFTEQERDFASYSHVSTRSHTCVLTGKRPRTNWHRSQLRSTAIDRLDKRLAG